MILTDFYQMEHLPGTKSKTRMDCTKSTRSYLGFEEKRNKKGIFFVHIVDADNYVKANRRRKADKTIGNSKGHISSVFVPDVTRLLAYGDVNHTQDALLYVFNEDYTRMDVFVARGQNNNKTGLYNDLADGELDEEIEELKKRALLESEL